MAVDIEVLENELSKSPKRWLVTGAAGFIGSNLVESLLRIGQEVVGLDNFSTGFKQNLEDLQTDLDEECRARFRFIEGDIFNLNDCKAAVDNIDFVLHQAALGSVPRSIEDPLSSHAANVDGFLNMLVASRDAGAARFVYASSSSVYGDNPDLPKVEDRIGRQLSPYAVTKRVNELYASVFAEAYGMEVIGLRYFNVFGPRQDPNGAYAAVVPRWIDALARNEGCLIYGDGETSRDFCFVDNAVAANILAACTDSPGALGKVFNVACGERTTLKQLYTLIRENVERVKGGVSAPDLEYVDFRAGDIRHSLADISMAQDELGFSPLHTVGSGMSRTVSWYLRS